MLQVTKSGRHVLLSVISLVESTRSFSDSIYDPPREVGMEEIQGVIDTGDLYGATAPGGHYCRMYRWADLKALLERHECEIVAASAANFLSVHNRRCSKRPVQTLDSGKHWWIESHSCANRQARSMLTPTLSWLFAALGLPYTSR